MNTESHGPGEIWKTLSGIDVSKYVEQKGGLDYLSWSAAWMFTVTSYPQADYWFSNAESGGAHYFKDDSAEVLCYVKINETLRSMHLPVMDFRNNAIISPDSRAISDTKQRCLVKTLAMHGLGISLYLGTYDDVPQDSAVEPKKAAPKKATPKKAAPKKNNNSGAVKKENKAVMTLKVFAEGEKSLDGLTTLYKQNKEVIEKMKKDDPSAYEETIDAFSRRKAALQNQQAQNK